MTNRVKKEQEALRRLRVLEKKGLMEGIASAYEESKQVFMSEFNGFAGILLYLDGAPDDVLNKIEELAHDGCIVYHATHERFEFGECWDLFVITDEDIADDEWGQGMREDFDEYGIQFAYVVNETVPEFSEFGSITVATCGGGLIRV